MFCELFITSGQRHLKQWPARRRTTILQRLIAAWMFSLVSAATCWVAFDMLDVWNHIDPALAIVSGSSPPLYLNDIRWIVALTMLIVMTPLWYVLLYWIDRRSNQYWRLEQLARWIAICGLLLWAGSHLMIRLDRQGYFGLHRTALWSHWPYNEGRTGYVVGFFAMLWGFGVRTVMLLMLRAYERACEQSDETLCFACEYDLRGSIPAGATTCPECGTPISKHLLTPST